VIPEGVEDEKVLFLSDILPTGWMPPTIAKSNQGMSWPCGDAVPWACSLSKVRSYWVRTA